MEKEELKGIIRETLEEFSIQYREKWEQYWHKWARLWREKELPPPPYWYPLISEEDVIKLRQAVRSVSEISESYEQCLLRLESWTAECSEKEKIKTIETSVKNIEDSVNDIRKILS